MFSFLFYSLSIFIGLTFTSLDKHEKVAKGKPLPTEKEITIDVPWGTISGLTWGDPTQPPILLLHGKMHACTTFRPLVSLLPPAHYIAFDWPCNGRSSHLPRGPKLTVMDFVPSVYLVVKHFRLEKFACIAHSLGVIIGKYFNITYPGYITSFVELDPIPGYHNWDPEDVDQWFRRYYHTHYVLKYDVMKRGPESAPSYEYYDIQQQFEDNGVDKASSEHLLERILEPSGDGRYRYTYDQRMKDVAVPPISGQYQKLIYTQTNIPILCILAQNSVTLGLYSKVPFVMDASQWKHKNYQFEVVPGDHNVHLTHPERFAGFVKDFLFAKSKL